MSGGTELRTAATTTAGARTFRAVDPATGREIEPAFEVTTPAELEAVTTAAAASASSASNSTIAQTVMPIASKASSSGVNCARSARSMPAPVL